MAASRVNRVRTAAMRRSQRAGSHERSGFILPALSLPLLYNVRDAGNQVELIGATGSSSPLALCALFKEPIRLVPARSQRCSRMDGKPDGTRLAPPVSFCPQAGAAARSPGKSSAGTGEQIAHSCNDSAPVPRCPGAFAADRIRVQSLAVECATSGSSTALRPLDPCSIVTVALR